MNVELHRVENPRTRAPLRIRLEKSEAPQIGHLERTEITTWTIWTQIVVNEDAVPIDRLRRLIEHYCRVVIRDGYRLPPDKPKRGAVASADPPLVVFAGTILLLKDAVEPFVQIDLECVPRLVADRNRRQDAGELSLSRASDASSICRTAPARRNVTTRLRLVLKPTMACS